MSQLSQNTLDEDADRVSRRECHLPMVPAGFVRDILSELGQGVVYRTSEGVHVEGVLLGPLGVVWACDAEEVWAADAELNIPPLRLGEYSVLPAKCGVV